MKKIFALILLFVFFGNNFAIAATKKVQTKPKRISTKIVNDIPKQKNEYTDIKVEAQDCKEFSLTSVPTKVKTSLRSAAGSYEYSIKNLTEHDIKLTNITFNQNTTLEQAKQDLEQRALKRTKPCIPTFANLDPIEKVGDGFIYAISFGGFIAPFIGLKDICTGHFSSGFKWIGGTIILLPTSAILAPSIIASEGLNVIFYPIKSANYNLVTKKRIVKDIKKYSDTFVLPITIKPNQEYKFTIIMPNNYPTVNVNIHLKDEKELKNYTIYNIALG